MKVAIIGAGVSGLTCAYRLNQLGIVPVVFEKKSIIGEPINLYGIHLHCFSYLAKNSLRYFEKQYSLRIEPMMPIHKIAMRSEGKVVNVKGRLGYIFNRGGERTSLERQLFDQVKGDFYLDTYINETMLEEVKKQFDAVVIATGECDFPDALGLWQETSVLQSRMGLLYGNYELGCITTWLQTEYSKSAYVYVVPITEKKAKIALIISQITPDELDYYWKRMLVIEGIEQNIIETWDCEFHCGNLIKNRLNNVYFVGNAGGMTDDYLGFGIMNGIASGIYAADAIMLGKSYEKSIEPILKKVENLHHLRLMANHMDNRDVEAYDCIDGCAGCKAYDIPSSYCKVSPYW